MKELMIVPKKACNNAKNAASQLFATKGDVTPAMYYNEMVDRVGKPIKGMEISVDVSTGDEDYDHRLHLTLTGECEDGTFYAYMNDNYQQWKPIKDAPLNVRILAAMKGDAPDICKLSFSPSGILVAHLDCGSQYNAKDVYEVYMELPKP